MNDLLSLYQKIVPEMIETLEKRYNILRNIYYNQPIGRRALANSLNIGERVVRTEINVLKDQGLLSVETIGMSITKEGKDVVERLKEQIHRFKGLNYLEKSLEKELNIRKVIIVPGNSDEDELILKDIGKATSNYIVDKLEKNSIIGITGGTTMAQVAEEMPVYKKKSDLLVLPARGGLGENVETQANNIAAKLAQKLCGNYKLLHVPDNLSEEAMEALLSVKEIKEVVDIMRNINMLVFGIGRADIMASRRHFSDDVVKHLCENRAVAESFGHYFNTKGKIIWETNTIGISLSDFKNIKTIIGVASGENKAEAIISICRLKEDMTLITDEGAAKKILNIVSTATFK